MDSSRAFDILVVSHGGLADGLCEAVGMLGAPTDNLTALALTNERGVEGFRHDVEQYLATRAGRQVVAFADLLGGTPHNVVSAELGRRAADDTSLVLVSGVNLVTVLAVALLPQVDRTTLEAVVADAGAAIAMRTPADLAVVVDDSEEEL